MEQEGDPDVKLPDHPVKTHRTIYGYDFCSAESFKVGIRSRTYITTVQISLADKTISSGGEKANK